MMKPVLLVHALIFSVCFFLLPTAFADNTPQPNPSFLSSCVDSWMKKLDQASDKLDYKNFGEKYCACASTQPLDNDQAIKKAIHLCMSRTVLHDTMDSLEEELGLSEVKDKDINEYCLDSWELAYPKQSDADKKAINDYCTCATPKLISLIKQSEAITDKQYSDTIDSIADSCPGNSSNNANTSQNSTVPEKK